MSETLVTRMARAMDQAAHEWALGTDNYPHECPLDVLALAALRAIREPTEGMMEEGRDEMPRGYPCRSIWRAMIDAAIAEAGGQEP